MTENKKSPKDLLPVWAKFAAISYYFDTTQSSSSDKKGYLDELDDLHDQLVKAIDAVEGLANRIQMSMPEDTPEDGNEQAK